MLLRISLIIFAYLFGSIPSGLIISKVFYHIDIRNFGSGNIGATNVYRTLGIFPSLFVFIFDALKGIIPTSLAIYFSPSFSNSFSQSVFVLLTGLFAIAGHNWSLYLKFTGGKGVTTAAGVLLVLFPQITLTLFLIFLLTLFFFRYVSLASILIALLFPFLVILTFPENFPFIVFSFLASSLVIYRHKSNLKRLIKREEPKITENFRRERL